MPLLCSVSLKKGRCKEVCFSQQAAVSQATVQQQLVEKNSLFLQTGEKKHQTNYKFIVMLAKGQAIIIDAQVLIYFF